ncbi:hypothetical protein HTV45_14815 [Streptomyces sp. CHD11]|uniref:hypothetical protein n=1 Tax=Streptomyces sp. CHD11 TaxID=2741325 RepID=UPI001BFBFD05|nr:hypothetical protein [Streptomyces sp. CHD11]MBT3152138.1 hypothetical protein [Streptomyces sp. CHD11]
MKDALGTADGMFVNAAVTRPPFVPTTENEYDELFDSKGDTAPGPRRPAHARVRTPHVGSGA